MCDPVIGATIMAVGTVAQGYSAMQQGKYEQGVAEYNARLSENEAQREKNIGVEEENKLRRAAAEMGSRQRAQFAARGVDINMGSPLAITEDTAVLSEVDARSLRTNYALSSKAMMDEATLQRAQGKAAAKAGRNAFMGSLLSAAGGFLATDAGAGVAKKWFSPSSAAATSAGNLGGSVYTSPSGFRQWAPGR